MKITKIQAYEISIDKNELQIIKNCLDYCAHRIKEHDKFKQVKLEDLEKIRKIIIID